MRKPVVCNFVTVEGYYEASDKTIDGPFEHQHPDYVGDVTRSPDAGRVPAITTSDRGRARLELEIAFAPDVWRVRRECSRAPRSGGRLLSLTGVRDSRWIGGTSLGRYTAVCLLTRAVRPS